MKIFVGLFVLAAAVGLLGVMAIYGASLRKSLMGNYEQVMATARHAVSDFSPIDD